MAATHHRHVQSEEDSVVAVEALHDVVPLLKEDTLQHRETQSEITVKLLLGK